MANAYINITQQTPPTDLLYINVKKSLRANSIIVPTTAIFIGASLLQPTSALPRTSVVNFEYYVNGQNVSSLMVNSLTESEGNVIFTFDTAQLGYELEADDEVIAIGKFA